VRDDGFAGFPTARLTVRRFVAADAAALSAYRADPVVARYQSWEPLTPDEAARFVASHDGLAPGTPEEWFQFAVALSGAQQLVGDLALRCTRDHPPQAEVGFTFARAFQGRGFASEAVRGLLAYAFDVLDVHRAYALTDERNHAAQRLLERTGFRREGHFRDSFWSKGEWTSELFYAVLRREWRARAT
jgi:aminoglycoside 6'-N-acetyltransferase